jgi:hypothetical protein
MSSLTAVLLPGLSRRPGSGGEELGQHRGEGGRVHVVGLPLKGAAAGVGESVGDRVGAGAQPRGLAPVDDQGGALTAARRAAGSEKSPTMSASYTRVCAAASCDAQNGD